MTLSRRDRREWRIIFWVLLTAAAISAHFGYTVAPPTSPPWQSALHGVITSFLIATPISLIELKWRYSAFMRRLRRLPLAVYFAIKLVFYFVVIVGSLVVMRVLTATDTPPFTVDTVFRNALVFSIAMSVIGNLVFDLGGLLGFGPLKNLLTGRYVQPRSEQRAFLLIDMKNSTGVAERLGSVHFHEFLNAFFRDVTDAALECEAEIHKYVGDEAILTWSDTGALADGTCLACPFVARDFMATNGHTYKRRFGVVPEFRASLHYGEIVAGEIGDVRREIAYVGDTLNVAARLLEAAKAMGHDILVSNDLLEHAKLPADIVAEPLPVLTVRGRAAPLGISALRRAAASA
jgi:adenylate cyclase